MNKNYFTNITLCFFYTISLTPALSKGEGVKRTFIKKAANQKSSPLERIIRVFLFFFFVLMIATQFR
nr:hypothetical protein [Mucilaginibacter sp. FT3.2]